MMSKIKSLICIIVILTFLLSLGCSGNDSSGVDSTPPKKPQMIPHIGDRGDKDPVNNVDILGFDGEKISDENNGIDAVEDENWIRVMWYPFLEDNDLDYIRLYRFYEDYDGIQELTLVDSISSNLNLNNSYVDRTLTQSATSEVDKTWHYYLELFDTSGNSSVSDTVNYHLLSKPLIESPANNSYIAHGDSLIFRWSNVSNVSVYRLMIFNEDMLDVWNFDFSFSFEDFPEVNFSATESPLAPGTYYFRIDAMTEDVDPASGSESNLYRFIIQ
jgi:hypothetical protein